MYVVIAGCPWCLYLHNVYIVCAAVRYWSECSKAATLINVHVIAFKR